MTCNQGSSRLAAAALLLALFAAGCSAHRGYGWAGCSCRPQATARNPSATAHHYDERRDDMQFRLAEARWRRNDIAGCGQLLEEVVQRNPRHRGAHLCLTELHLLNNQPAKALTLMQGFCREHRQDAEAHHLLGLCHEAVGKPKTALVAYQLAVKLDPEEALYRSSLETAQRAQEKTIEIAASASSEKQKASPKKPGEKQASSNERARSESAPVALQSYELEYAVIEDDAKPPQRISETEAYDDDNEKSPETNVRSRATRWD